MQHTGYILMIEPVNFGFNAETAVNNSFQENNGQDTQEQALYEFNGFVKLLRENKVNVTVIKDTADPFTPDSIFPNNWISFHENDDIFLYPMFAVNRRFERKEHILELINKKFLVAATRDLSHYESENRFLEGTGSMVLDRKNRIAYACRSIRTDEKLLQEFCSMNNYNYLLFSANDEKGREIYHTNVMMSIGDQFAVVCLECITDRQELKTVQESLAHTQKEIIEISAAQMNDFAGNMLQVKNTDNEKLLLMSTQAYLSLSAAQVSALSKYSRLLHSALDTIETAGGGSARCMIAEIFNTPK